MELRAYLIFFPYSLFPCDVTLLLLPITKTSSFIKFGLKDLFRLIDKMEKQLLSLKVNNNY